MMNIAIEDETQDKTLSNNILKQNMNVDKTIYLQTILLFIIKL